MNGVWRTVMRKKSGRNIMNQKPENGEMKIMTVKKCENCGKVLDNSLITHCSDKCLFESIKKSREFMS